jgi:hypothetical protein
VLLAYLPASYRAPSDVENVTIHNIILSLFVAIAIVGCGQNKDGVDNSADEAIKAELRKNIAKPDTAKIGDAIISADGKSACIMFTSVGTNGKEMAWSSVLFRKMDDKWRISGLNGDPAECRMKR